MKAVFVLAEPPNTYERNNVNYSFEKKLYSSFNSTEECKAPMYRLVITIKNPKSPFRMHFAYYYYPRVIQIDDKVYCQGFLDPNKKTIQTKLLHVTSESPRLLWQASNHESQ